MTGNLKWENCQVPKKLAVNFSQFHTVVCFFFFFSFDQTVLVLIEPIFDLVFLVLSWLLVFGRHWRTYFSTEKQNIMNINFKSLKTLVVLAPVSGDFKTSSSQLHVLTCSSFLNHVGSNGCFRRCWAFDLFIIDEQKELASSQRSIWHLPKRQCSFPLNPLLIPVLIIWKLHFCHVYITRRKSKLFYCSLRSAPEPLNNDFPPCWKRQIQCLFPFSACLCFCFLISVSCSTSSFLHCCYVPFSWASVFFLCFLSPQVAIKIIDKTQLNPNSLQKVIYPPSLCSVVPSRCGRLRLQFMRHNRLSINCANGKQGMLGRRVCSPCYFILVGCFCSGEDDSAPHPLFLDFCFKHLAC